jgi:CheY-like chemotaxis protein
MNREIIIADESIIIQKTVEQVLSGKDFNIGVVYENESALRMIREQLPDIVLVDTELQETGGYELCSIIKKDPGLKNIRVILMVPSVNKIEEERIRETLADGYLVKPFEPGELLDKVMIDISQENRVLRLEKKLIQAEEKISSDRKEMFRHILYEAAPELEKTILEELNKVFRKTVEKTIPYAIERIITERMEKNKAKDRQNQKSG